MVYLFIYFCMTLINGSVFNCWPHHQTDDNDRALYLHEFFVTDVTISGTIINHFIMPGHYHTFWELKLYINVLMFFSSVSINICWPSYPWRTCVSSIGSTVTKQLNKKRLFSEPPNLPKRNYTKNEISLSNAIHFYPSISKF